MGRISPVRVSATVSFCCRFQLQQILCATINSVHLACLLTSCSITLHWRLRNRGTFYKYLAISWDSDTKMSFISFFINSILKAKHQVSVDIAGNRKRRKQNCGFFVNWSFMAVAVWRLNVNGERVPKVSLSYGFWAWGGGNQGATICVNKKMFSGPLEFLTHCVGDGSVCACFVCLFVAWVLQVALSCIVVVIWSEFCDNKCRTGFKAAALVPHWIYSAVSSLWEFLAEPIREGVVKARIVVAVFYQARMLWEKLED